MTSNTGKTFQIEFGKLLDQVWTNVQWKKGGGERGVEISLGSPTCELYQLINQAFVIRCRENKQKECSRSSLLDMKKCLLLLHIVKYLLLPIYWEKNTLFRTIWHVRS